MLYKALVILHLLGAAVWIGGHVVLLRVISPAAAKDGDVRRVLEFERGYGKIGLAALAAQVVTGLWLAGIWLGGGQNILDFSSPVSRLVLLKLALLAATVGQAGYAYHKVLPRLESNGLGAFKRHAWSITVLAILMLVAGASIRLGGLF